MAPTWLIPSGADGTTMTAANTGAQQVTATGGGGGLYKTAAAYPGVATGWRMTAAAANNGVLRFMMPSTTVPTYSYRVNIATPSVTPNADETIWKGSVSGTGGIFYVRYTVAGNIVLVSNTSVSYTLVAAAPLSTKYDITLLITVNTTTAASGSFTANVYTPGTTTKVAGPVTSSTANFGLNPIGLIDVGPTTAETVSNYVDIGAVGYEAGSTTEIPPYTTAANVAPTVNPGATQTVAGTTVSLSGSATDSDGTMSSAVWSLLSTTAGTNPTVGSTTNTGGGTATITAAASGTGLITKSTNVFRLTTTDNSGAVTTGDVTVYVSGTPVAANRVISNAGAWGAVGAATLDAAVNKATDTDTTYIETPATPVSASVILGLEPIALGDETITIRMRYVGTGTFTCIPKLYSGSTLITTAATPITLTSAFANYPIPLRPSENANVANRNDIRVELVATQS